MKWRKLGRIFDPREHALPLGCTEYAQSPQTLVFDDFIRIYFSTRARDHSGKFLSHVAFVDMDRQLSRVLAVSSGPVIGLGGLGCYDEHGIFPFHVVRDGNRILGYISGWSRRVSVSVETSIGLAVSHDDGLTYTRLGPGPILTSSLHEPFLVGDPCVIRYGDGYHMWYIYGTAWVYSAKESAPQRIYKIGHATSGDGVSWRKAGGQVIRDRLGEDECQALPTVLRRGSRHHMFFCYRQATDFRSNNERSYRIGYAYADDPREWVRRDDDVGIDVSAEGWDSGMLCYPHVFSCDGRVYLLYNGADFGRFGFGLAVLEEPPSPAGPRGQ